MRSNSRRLNPIFSRASARTLGCRMTMADVRSALASKNLAMKNMRIMTAQKYTKKSSELKSRGIRGRST